MHHVHSSWHVDDGVSDPSRDDVQTSDTMRQPHRRPRWLWPAALVTAVALVVLGVVLLTGGPGAARTEPAVRPVPVRAVLTARGDLSVQRQLPGELVAEAAALSPRVAGRLESVRVRPGDRLEAGETVAVIDAAELVRERQEQSEQIRVLEANLRRARARLDEASSELARGSELAASNLISAQELERLQAQLATMKAEAGAVAAQIEQAQARAARLDEQLAETQVRAPFTGTVAERFLDPGAVVQPGTPIVRLVQDRPLLVQFRAPERLLGRLVVGAPFTVTTQATGAQEFAGAVVRISGEVARTDRSVLVEGELGEQSPALRPGMYADVNVQLDVIADAVLVPGAAVIERMRDGEVGRGVFVAPGHEELSAAQWREVRILELEGETAAVQGDLTDGERVLTLGHEELADGSPVRIVEGPGSTPEPGEDR